MPDQENLEIVIQAKDEATKVLQNLSTTVTKTTGAVSGLTKETDTHRFSITKMATAVGLGTIAADAFRQAMRFVTTTLKGSITAAKEAEASQVKVNAILKTLTGSYEANTLAVKEASEAAMQLGFDDEDAAESMAKLLQVTGKTTDAQTALQAAMDLARFKGIGLEEATQAMTLAFQGSGRVLKQLGIDVPDNASKMEILGLVHERVAGQAESFGNSAAGAQERFKVALENLQESIGSRVLPVLTGFFNRVSEFLTSAVGGEGLEGFLQRVGTFLRDNFAPAWERAVAALQPYLPMIKEVAKVLGVIVGSAVLGGIILLNNFIAAAVEAFGRMLDVVQKIGEAIGAFVNKLQGIGSAPGNFTQAIADKIFGRQFGGSVRAGQPYVVGEQGPEMFVPDVGGRVVPNSSGAITVNFNNPVVRSDADLDKIVSEVSRVLGRRSELANRGAF